METFKLGRTELAERAVVMLKKFSREADKSNA
jgi:hypothetical protein